MMRAADVKPGMLFKLWTELRVEPGRDPVPTVNYAYVDRVRGDRAICKMFVDIRTTAVRQFRCWSMREPWSCAKLGECTCIVLG